jgi:hypothetical protein
MTIKVKTRTVVDASAVLLTVLLLSNEYNKLQIKPLMEINNCPQTLVFQELYQPRSENNFHGN